MDDENTSHNGEKTTSLLDLPNEIILHICSFIDTLTLHGLSLVCKRFNVILKENTLMWKARINSLYLPYFNYPLLQPANPNELFWKRSCVAIEKLYKSQFFAKNFETQIANPRPLSSWINNLLLMHSGTTCIASLQRPLIYKGILLYCKIPSFEEVRSCKYNTPRVVPNYIESAHNSEIRGLTAIDNTIYSCSLDKSIKSWMFINTGLFEQRTYELSDSDELLCVSSCPERGLFATGSRNGTIFIFDSRQDKPIMQYRPHTRDVFELAMNSKYILSTSKDRTVSVWDQRAGRTMKSITISGYGDPTCMNMQRDWVCVGDSTGKLHLLDLSYDFEVKSYSSKHLGSIIGVHMTDGYLISMSYWDHYVIFWSLMDPPQPIGKLFLGRRRENHCRMDYLNDTLAISNIEIRVWRIQ